jgi:hypothetical protein
MILAYLMPFILTTPRSLLKDISEASARTTQYHARQLNLIAHGRTGQKGAYENSKDTYTER